MESNKKIMRIISGKLKGKKISFINSSTTRPLRDYVKENIFNVLLHHNDQNLSLVNSNILDLYAGVGSFGIECLSRNVKSVVFIEKDPLAFSILKKNILNLKLTKKAKLFSQDTKDYLKNFGEGDKFDFIFLDPPYKDDSYIEIINLIKKKKIFNENHQVIIHRERKCEEELNKVLKINSIRNYGRSKIIFGSF